MTSPRLLHLLVAVLATMLLQTGCYRVMTTRCAEAPATGLDAFSVDLANADVELQGDSSTDTLWVQAEFEVLGLSRHAAREAFDDVTLEIVTSGSEARIVVDMPMDVDATQMVLYVPDHLRGVVETTNGEIYADDMHGDLDVSSTNGTIEVSRGSGTITAGTTNGEIRVDDHLGSVDLATTNGDVEMDLLLPAGGYGYAASTNGEISLRIPDDTAATLQARTTNGDIRIEGLDFQGSLDHDEAEGVIQGGGATEIRLGTTNGDIDLVGVRGASDSAS
jgi:hypothetical protein